MVIAVNKKPSAPAPKAKAAAVEKIEKVKKPGVGDFVKKLIMEGKTNEKILELVTVKFPEAKTTNSSVNWYRSDLRKQGEEVPSSRVPKAPKTAAAKAPAPAKKPVAKKAAGGDEGGF